MALLFSAAVVTGVCDMMPGQIPDPSVTAGSLPSLGPLVGISATTLTEHMKYADLCNLGAMLSPLHLLGKLGKRTLPIKAEVSTFHPLAWGRNLGASLGKSTVVLSVCEACFIYASKWFICRKPKPDSRAGNWFNHLDLVSFIKWKVMFVCIVVQSIIWYCFLNVCSTCTVKQNDVSKL